MHILSNLFNIGHCLELIFFEDKLGRVPKMDFRMENCFKFLTIFIHSFYLKSAQLALIEGQFY